MLRPSTKNARWIWFAVLAVALTWGGLTAGCAEGPLWRSGYLSPQVRERWAEEERIASTLFGRRRQMREMVEEALDSGTARQEEVARYLGEVVVRDPVLLLRLEAVERLAELPVESAAASLAVAAGDADVSVRLAAVRSLGKRTDATSVARLAEVSMSDADLDVRIAATTQLGNTTSPSAIPALKKALADADPAMQVSAARSLTRITGQKFGDDIVKWQEYMQAQESSGDLQQVAGRSDAESTSR